LVLPRLWAMKDHLTYVTLNDRGGYLTGTATCEVCGPLSRWMYLDRDEALLTEIADQHWVTSSDRTAADAGRSPDSQAPTEPGERCDPSETPQGPADTTWSSEAHP
jgi:hypothetical protein